MTEHENGCEEFLAIALLIPASFFATYPLVIGWGLAYLLVADPMRLIGIAARPDAIVPLLLTSATAAAWAYASYRALDHRMSSRPLVVAYVLTVGTIAITLAVSPKFFRCITYC